MGPNLIVLGRLSITLIKCMGNIFQLENLNITFNCFNRKRKLTMAEEIKSQLYTYHNPFSGTTSQPKIPDGKATHSLGFSTQSVLEISNGGGVETMHFLLYPGMNSCLVAEGAFQSGLGRTYYVPNFSRSGTVDWANVGTTSPFEISNNEGYAKWRSVSVGMQLKLLNSVEEDDGWWEACRVNEALNPADWLLTTADNGSLIETALGKGALVPVELNRQLSTREIANEPTYMTGLLRDLHRVQFECHPVADEHDFTTMKDKIYMRAADYTHRTALVECSIDEPVPNAYELLENFVDQGHDMVYLRLHCRSRTAESNGSRFHVNLVENQEVIYDSNDRLARYQTRSKNIGDGNMDAHTRMRRGHGGAANMVS